MKELNQLNKNVIFSYLPRFLNFIIVPAQMSILINNLSTELYGIWVMLQSSGVMLTFIFTFGLQKYLSVNVPGKTGEIQYGIFKSIFYLEIMLYIIFSLVLIVNIEYILPLIKLGNHSEIAIKIIVIFLVYLSYNELGRFLNYQKKIEERVKIVLVEKILELCLIVSAFYLFEASGLSGLVIVYGILYTTMTIIICLRSIKLSYFFSIPIKKKYSIKQYYSAFH